MDQHKRQIPDFLIVGTMKGGTTVLYDFITLHPDVEKASKKEIHYFTLHYNKGPEWYLAHFKKNSNKLTGEASPTYFDIADSTIIPTKIRNFNPNVKIMLIIRDPIERAISQFIHLCKVGKIQQLRSMDVNDFFNLPLSETIKEETIEESYLRRVISFSTYYEKYLHYKGVFDASNILIITNKELKEAPFETMSTVYRFIGVTPIELKAFRRVSFSAGTTIDVLNDRTYHRLAEMLYPDYRNFCNASGIEYSEVKPGTTQTENSKKDSFWKKWTVLRKRL